MKKKTWILLAVVALAFLALNGIKNLVVTQVARKAIAGVTQFDVRLKAVRVDLLRSRAIFKGLELRNPDTYPDPEAIHIQRFMVDFKWGKLLGDTVELKRVDLSIDRVAQISTPDQPDNLMLLNRNLQALKEKETSPGEAPGGEAPGDRPAPPAEEEKPEKDIRIENLNLYLGELHMRSYDAEGALKDEKTIEINHQYAYEDIQSIYKVTGQIVQDVTARVAPQLILNIAESFEESGGTEKIERDVKKMGDWLRKQFDPK